MAYPFVNIDYALKDLKDSESKYHECLETNNDDESKCTELKNKSELIKNTISNNSTNYDNMIVDGKYNFTTIEKAFRDMQSIINNCINKAGNADSCKDDPAIKIIQKSILDNAIKISELKKGGKKSRHVQKNKKRRHSYKKK